MYKRQGLGIEEARIKGRFVVDMLHFYKRLTQSKLSSYKLKDIVKEENLGIDYDYIPKNFKKEWQETPEKIIDYNKKDVESIVKLEEVVKPIGFHKALADFIGCEIDETDYNSKIIDFYLLKKAKEKGIVLPTKKQGEKSSYKGAVVLDPVKGLHKNVLVFDFASLYPNIMLSFNLSPETKNKEGIKVNGISWSKDRGFIPSIISELFSYRYAIKKERDKYEPGSRDYELYDNKQTAVKFIINSLYGYFGFSEGTFNKIFIQAAWTK